METNLMLIKESKVRDLTAEILIRGSRDKKTCLLALATSLITLSDKMEYEVEEVLHEAFNRVYSSLNANMTEFYKNIV